MDSFLSQSLIQRLGWILVHFIWQGAAVALLVSVLLQILRRRDANTRYIVSCGAMFLMAALPLVTVLKGSAPTARQTLQTVQRPATVPERPRNQEPSRPAISPPPPRAKQNLSPPISDPTPRPKPRVLVRYDIRTLIEPHLPVVVLVWLLGFFTLSVWRMGGWVELQRFKRRHVKPICVEWRERIESLIQKVGIDRPVRVVESAIVQIPSTIGWLKPVVLVPTSALTGLPPERLEAIIAHELAHIRRHDYLINLMQTAVETLFFYHPAVWWVSHRIRTEREHCCDEIAVDVCGDAHSYASALAELEQFRHTSAQLAMAADRGHLSNRIRHVLNIRSPRSNRSNAWIAGPVGIVIVALLCFLTLAQATPADSIFPLRGPGGEFLLGHGALDQVAFSPDGNYLMTGNGTGMYLWDLATGEIVRAFTSLDVCFADSLEFSSDGEKILVVSTGWVSGPASVFDVATGEKLCTVEPVRSAAFSPDGNQVAAASWGGYLCLFDAETGAIIRDLQLQRGYVGRQGVAYSPDGDEVLIAVTEGTIIWDPATGGVLRVDEPFLPDAYFEGTQASGGECVAVSHDGEQYVTLEYAGASKWETTAILRDLQTSETIATYGPYQTGRSPRQAFFSSDDSKVLIVDGSLWIWDLETGELTIQGDSTVFSAVFSPDGSTILAVESEWPYETSWARLRDTATGELLRAFPAPIEVRALAFSHDGREILTVGKAAAVHLWNAHTVELLQTYDDFGVVEFNSAIFSQDGTRILAEVQNPTHASWNDRVLFDTATGSIINRFGQSDGGMAMSPDGKKVLTGDGATASLFDAETGERLHYLSREIEDWAYFHSASFSPDGGKIFTRITGDNQIWTVWDAETGDAVYTDYPEPVFAFTSDGNGFLIATGGSTVTLYDAASGEPLRSFHHSSNNEGFDDAVQFIACSPDGTKFATAGWRTLNLWDAATGRKLHSVQCSDDSFTSCIAFSPDGMIIVTATRYEAKMWNTATGEAVGNFALAGVLPNLIFSPDGARLAVMGAGGARMWDISDMVNNTGIRNFPWY